MQFVAFPIRDRCQDRGLCVQTAAKDPRVSQLGCLGTGPNNGEVFLAGMVQGNAEILE